jgi:zinc protease
VVLSHQTGVRIPVALPVEPTARTRSIGVALLAWGLLASSPAFAQPRGSSPAAPRLGTIPKNVERLDSLGGITEYRLRSNGMRILLSQNRAAPVITFLVVYHVGSRNEAPGNTGSAHLLEHMLFNKSTQHFGHANGHKTFQEVLYEAGADFSSTNMTTWYDRMTGFSTLPSNRLRLAMEIEADRMGHALILDQERKPEMSVVLNEYEIGENNPYQALQKAVIAASIVAHPYHWDTIGYRSDVERVSTETLREHYHHFFRPDNAEAILVGDFDPGEALRLFDQTFGKLPRSTAPIPQVITVEPPQEGERRVTVTRPGEIGIVEIAYIRPGSLHPDFIPLDLFATILSGGVNSRLYQALVETGLATDVDASNYTLRNPYPLLVEATLAERVPHAKVESVMKTVLREIADHGVTAVELERAKRQLEVSVVRSRDGTYQLARALGEAVASADWKWFVHYLEQMRKVAPEDIQRVAKTYCIPEHATVGWFVPIPSKPAAAKPPARPKPPARSKRPGAGGASEDPLEASRRFGDRTMHLVLPNGIIVNVVENHAVPTVALHGLVLAGRQESPEEPALPLLTANMISRGTKTRDKLTLSRMLESVGADLSVTADLSEATIVGSALSRDTPTLLAVLADELSNAIFPESELIKAKSELRADLLRGYDNTGVRARERLSRLVYPKGHPFRAPEPSEMLRSLEAARNADLRSFYRRRYAGSGIILSLVGDVDTARVAVLVDSLFGEIQKGARPSYDLPRTAPVGVPQRVIETMHGKANLDFVYGEASGLRRTDPDWEAAIVANAALGQSSLTSRIGKRVRDTEGLSYTLYSRYLWSDYIDGVWMVDVAVAPKNAARALRSTREEIERYAREGISESEVEVQKSYFAGNYRVRLGSNAGIAFSLTYAEKYGYGPRYLDEFPNRVRAVTREQVNRVIRQRLLPEKLHLVLAGDLDSIPQ